MKFNSEQDIKDMGAALGKAMASNFPELIEKMMKDSGESEGNVISKLVEEKMREMMQVSSTRKSAWGLPSDPMAMIGIEKSLDAKATDKTEALAEFQKFNDDLYTLSKSTGIEVVNLKSFPEYEAQWKHLAKALNISTAGQGLEWIPTGYSNQMIQFAEIEAVVATLFPSFNMPNSPFKAPSMLADGTAYKGGVSTSDDPAMYKASTPTTADLTFTAEQIITNYRVEDTMMEDAVVSMLPVMQKSIARTIARARDVAIINGQKTATLDTGDVPAADDVRKLWDGLRYLTQSTLKQDGSTWSTAAGLALFRSIKEDMGKYALKPMDVAVIANANMVNKFRALAEVSSVDKFGSAATIKNGILTAIDGNQIVASEDVAENVNATGIYDGTTTTKTQYLVVNKTGFMRGIRRNFTLEKERVARTGSTYLVATAREHWKAIYDTTTQPMIGWQYNVAK